MKETILLFHVPDKKQRLKIEKALFPLKVRLRYVNPADYDQPLGALAGIKELPSAEGVCTGQDLPSAEGACTGQDLPDTMFVFAFFSDSRLNQVLAALRKSGAGPFPYKAVLTPTNQFWTAFECFNEIRQEHEAMHP